MVLKIKNLAATDLTCLNFSKSDFRYAESRASVQRVDYRPRILEESKKSSNRKRRQLYGGVGERIRELEYELVGELETVYTYLESPKKKYGGV